MTAIYLLSYSIEDADMQSSHVLSDIEPLLANQRLSFEGECGVKA
jgi:hypothetical protein